MNNPDIAMMNLAVFVRDHFDEHFSRHLRPGVVDYMTHLLNEWRIACEEEARPESTYDQGSTGSNAY